MADKTYRLTFKFSNGTQKSVLFSVPQGKSAYQYAVEGGYTGSEEDFIKKMASTGTGSGTTVEVGARISEVNLIADKWVKRTDRVYSQVVAIEGITSNSKVDLTPSAEQLNIFYEKDLAFVTENEGGVVTVYVIGQKPEGDYIIQVTITEVTHG